MVCAGRSGAKFLSREIVLTLALISAQWQLDGQCQAELRLKHTRSL